MGKLEIILRSVSPDKLDKVLTFNKLFWLLTLIFILVNYIDFLFIFIISVLSSKL